MIDWLALGPDGVITAEAKFTEKGFGGCRCQGRTVGTCSQRVLDRPYWAVATRDLGLARDSSTTSCSLSLAYQAVRNVAAAGAIAGDRRAAASSCSTTTATRTSPAPATGRDGSRHYPG